MPVFQPIPGMPGVSSEKLAKHRVVTADGYLDFLPGGVILDGAKTRDPGNSDDVTRLRAGLLIGKVAANGKYANAAFGLSTGAITNAGTTLASSAAIAAELLRRVGATGTFKLTGPPTAAGVVRTRTATYSALNTTTGDITLTALGVNEVQTVNLSTAATGGSIRLLVPKTDGTTALTPAAAWSGTDATLLSNLNTALDTATGVVGGIVATAIAATDTDLGFVLTFSGTGYAGLSWPLAQVDTLFTSNTGANVVRTTAGQDGRFVTGSLIQPTDGSETPASFLPDGWELALPADGTSDIPLAQFPIRGNVEGSNLLPWPADASLRQWVRDQLNLNGRYTFTEKF